MRIVTSNLRCQTEADGINSYRNRKGLIFETLNAEMPDIIGFQEITPEMFRDLISNLSGYTVIGHGRESDLMGEHNPIAFRKDRFELYGLEVFWLSDKPDEPGSRFEKQSSCPRICTRAVLSPLDESKPFYFYNTHLDHRFEEARLLGARQIAADIRAQQAKKPLPAIVTGDFNAFPDEACLGELLSAGLTDTTGGIENSYHGYGTVTQPRIDYILTKGFTQKAPAFAWKVLRDGVYFSDHDAIEVELC